MVTARVQHLWKHQMYYCTNGATLFGTYEGISYKWWVQSILKTTKTNHRLIHDFKGFSFHPVPSHPKKPWNSKTWKANLKESVSPLVIPPASLKPPTNSSCSLLPCQDFPWMPGVPLTHLLLYRYWSSLICIIRDSKPCSPWAWNCILLPKAWKESSIPTSRAGALWEANSTRVLDNTARHVSFCFYSTVPSWGFLMQGLFCCCFGCCCCCCCRGQLGIFMVNATVRL